MSVNLNTKSCFRVQTYSFIGDRHWLHFSFVRSTWTISTSLKHSLLWPIVHFFQHTVQHCSEYNYLICPDILKYKCRFMLLRILQCQGWNLRRSRDRMVVRFTIICALLTKLNINVSFSITCNRILQSWTLLVKPIFLSKLKG
jgi:hypothetical protein